MEMWTTWKSRPSSGLQEEVEEEPFQRLQRRPRDGGLRAASISERGRGPKKQRYMKVKTRGEDDTTDGHDG